MRQHPHLLTTPEGIERARRLVEREEWARDLRDRLVAEARTLDERELPVFETDWWETAKREPWQRNYTAIHYHCQEVPLPMMWAAWRAAIAYALTEDNAIAENVLRVLRHYTAYSYAFEHPDVGMEYTGWGSLALEAYDFIHDSVPDDDRPAFDDFCARMLAAVRRNDEWWIANNPGGRFNNHFAWHKLLIGAQGLFYERDDLIEYAIEGEQGFRELIEHGWLDDGLWFESSINYHFVALLPMVLMAEMLRNSGYPFDLYTHRFANGRTLRDAFRGPIEVAFPDLTLPTIGDCYGATTRLPDCLKYGLIYEYAWRVYRDPAFAWVVSQRAAKPDGSPPERLFVGSAVGDGGAPPAALSRTLPEHGYVMLRSVEGTDYWGSDGWAAFLSHDRDSVHSNRDKLSLLLFGRGALLAPDCEAKASAPHAFSAQVQRELNRSTICHNTVMVDGAEHAWVRDRLEVIQFTPLPTVKTATIGDLRGLVYPGVRMQRTVAVTDDYVLDVFQVASDEERRHDWLFHANADAGITHIAGEFAPSALPTNPPWSWLRNARSRTEDGTWRAEWTVGEVTLRLTMLGWVGTEIVLCDFPRDDQYQRPPYAMLTAQRRGKHATFVALYQAGRGAIPEVSVTAREDGDCLRVNVVIEGRALDHMLPLL